MPHEDPQQHVELVAQFNAIAARDKRVALIRDEMAIEHEFANSATLKALMAQLEADQQTAIEAFSAANPGDTQHIMYLQSRVFALQYIKQFLQAIKHKANLAHLEIRAEEQGRDG